MGEVSRTMKDAPKGPRKEKTLTKPGKKRVPREYRGEEE